MNAIKDALLYLGGILILLVLGGVVLLLLSLPSKALAIVVLTAILVPPPVIYFTMKSRGADPGEAIGTALVGLLFGPALVGVVMMICVLASKNMGRPKSGIGG